MDKKLKFRPDGTPDISLPELSLESCIQNLSGVSKFAGIEALKQISGRPPEESPLVRKNCLRPGPPDPGDEKIPSTIEAELKSAIERTSARLTHAVNTLRRKNLRPTGVEDLAKLVSRQDRAAEGAAIWLVQCYIGQFICDGDKDLIPDDIYEFAIEMAMLIHEKDLMFSTNLYGQAVTWHLDTIYAFALLMYYASYMKEKGDMIIKKTDEIKHLAKPYGGIDGLLNHITEESENIRKQIEAEFNVKKEQLTAQYNEKIASLDRQIRNYSGKIKPLESKLATTNSRAQAAEETIKRLKARNRELESALDERDALLAKIAASTKPDSKTCELPESGVIVAGGLPQQIAAIREKHPKWRFIAKDDTAFQTIGNPTFIVCLHEYISHSVWWKIKAGLNPKTPVIFAGGTNSERLESDIRNSYAAIVAGKKHDYGNKT